VFDNCPSAAHRTTSYLAELPDMVVEAELARAAQASYCLNLVLGGVADEEREPQRGIQAKWRDWTNPPLLQRLNIPGT